MSALRRGSLGTGVPRNFAGEQFTTLIDAPGACIERIVSLGHVTEPGRWYDQDRHEWVLVVHGAARLQFEGKAESITLRGGDYIDIPAHCRHRIEWTDPQVPTVWVAVHYA